MLVRIASLGQAAVRHGSAREEAREDEGVGVNTVMTATYWLVGRRIVEQEQGGKARAGYGEAILGRLAADLTARFGRGFSLVNLETMRIFFQTYPDPGSGKPQTLSGVLLAVEKPQTLSGELASLGSRFRLSWSHYALLVRTRSPQAREFYETEALRGGWTVRQLRRQLDSQFYERTALSRNKAAMLRKGSLAKPEDAVTPEEEIKSPYVLEFLGLEDEYSESDLDAPLPQLRTRALVSAGREPARRAHPLCRPARSGGPLRPRRAAQQDPRVGVPHDTAAGGDDRRGARAHPPSHRGTGGASQQEAGSWGTQAQVEDETVRTRHSPR